MASALLDAPCRRALIAALAEEDPFCAEPPAAAAESWSEARIRAFFEAGGVDAGEADAAPQAAPALLTKEQARQPTRCAARSSAARSVHHLRKPRRARR
jgi:hypothetical protein